MEMICVLFRVLQRNRTNRMYVCAYVYLFIYYKQLAHTIIEAGKAKICRMGQQVEDMIQSECCPLAEFSPV